MKYSIVIPTLNHCNDLLIPCIDSIKKYTNLEDLEIIIVANGCTDNTKEYVLSLGEPFKLLWFDEPLGYTKATNYGIKAAIGDYVLLLNNDIEILPCEKSFWLEQLQKPFIDNQRMAMTGSLKLFDRDIQQNFIVFCCALIKRDIFAKIGLLDEIFSPGYGEDIDFSMRVIQHGYEWHCIDETRFENGTNVGWFPIWHKGTQTFKDIPDYGSVVVERNRKILVNRYNLKLQKPIMRSNMKYSIVIPTYNHCNDYLRPCIESIFKYSKMSDVELIVSANGCVDSTKLYLDNLKLQFDSLGFSENLKIVWNDRPLGYAIACNEGIKVATTDLIVLFNNDALLLPQSRGDWLYLLENPFNKDESVGITCVVKGPSEPAGHDFAVFFCVMIHRKVFERIGLLNPEYGEGGGEDTEFCIEAERAGFKVTVAIDSFWHPESGMYAGTFPLYHRGQGTLHDSSLVPNHSEIFLRNSLLLAKKYNKDWYRWRISNFGERAVFLKGDPLMPNYPRENNRYVWANSLLIGKKVLEIGCSSGFGTQYLPADIDYTGVDYDSTIIQCAKDQDWGPNFKFVHADINKFDLEMYDTIIAFEVIEHLTNGLEVVERLKKHCKRLLISVPYMEPPGFWGHYHMLHGLNESHFPGFEYIFCTENGTFRSTPDDKGPFNLLLMKFDCNQNDLSQHIIRPTSNANIDVTFLYQQHKEIYDEVITHNIYDVKFEQISNKTVIDIGANIGTFTLLAASMNAKKIYAVEPTTDTYFKLRENIAIAGADNIITLKNAVTSRPGEVVKIGLFQEAGHNSLYSTENFELIETVTLGQILKMSDDTDILLKMDCEGSEFDILLNATNEELSRISRIVMEVHDGLNPRYTDGRQITEKLTNCGFKIENIKQAIVYDVDANGRQFNIKNLPYRVEIWSR